MLDKAVNQKFRISIHALVKRATLFIVCPQRNYRISIHALVKRATSHFAFIAFQLVISIHALVKRATARAIDTQVVLYISIHALVKRATYCNAVCRHNIRDFNPRPREEGDYRRIQDSERLGDFNPRPREEGDPYLTGEKGFGNISIHALVKRATLFSRHSNTPILHFNPRPREEGDHFR